MSCQQVPTAPAFNPYPRSVQVGEFEVAIGGGIWVAIGGHMGEEDLLYLNRMVVERLNLLAQARSTVELAQFAEGDLVHFTATDGSVKHGVVLRLNKKTASVRTDEGQNWKVSPGLLRKTATR